MTDEITTLREQIAALTTDKEHAYTLLERMTQDKDCAWQNVHILERARQQQDTKIAALTKERDDALEQVRKAKVEVLREAAEKLHDYGNPWVSDRLRRMADEIEKEERE